jgi:DinB family protein
MTDFDAALTGFADLDEDALGRPWRWRGATLDLRYALYRTLEEAQEACVDAVGGPHPESRRTLALAQRAFGDLRGLLIGLPTELLDREPRSGEWPVREVLRHMLSVERRYAVQTRYAVERADHDPVRIPEDRLPTTAPTEVGGDVAAVLARLGQARSETNRRLCDLAPAALTRPSLWVKVEIDVRFRLHRFAAHVIEHTIQCEKTLAALGWHPTEGRRIVRQLTGVLGELEAYGALAAVRVIEAALTDRFVSLGGAVSRAGA